MHKVKSDAKDQALVFPNQIREARPIAFLGEPEGFVYVGSRTQSLRPSPVIRSKSRKISQEIENALLSDAESGKDSI
jgi:hypothetical protein